MALTTVHGDISNLVLANSLSSKLSQIIDKGFLYLGYPVLTTPDGLVKFDALLVCSRRGLVAFQFGRTVPDNETEWEELVDEQNDLFGALDSHLRRYPKLRRGRNLAFPINVITILGSLPRELTEDSDTITATLDSLEEVILEFTSIEDYTFVNLQAVIQSVSSLKPLNKRDKVTNVDSRGGKLQFIEKQMANLDSHQLAAAIETPDGGQRIRGLAGSGKTVVLALKATLQHVQHPDRNIAITFQSRALYQQFENFITRFCFERIQEAPNYEKLKIQHAWGSSSKGGIYYSICEALGELPRDFNSAQRLYGRTAAFQGVCRELLEIAQTRKVIPPLFDLVLIDEAQDFPPEFFKLIYLFTAEPKRIVWAYDELQTLSQAVMPDVSELFGQFENGSPRVSLDTTEGEPHKDIMLPMCYRNTPWTIAVAHAVGYGINRPEGLVQHFERPEMWKEVGYRKVSGQLEAGQSVVLERSPECTPGYFSDLLDVSDVVITKLFINTDEQDSWIATEIQKNIEEDELDATDILIVLPSPLHAQKRAFSIRNALIERGISSHLVGVNSGVDTMYLPDSVAIAHIFRAKGNEAAMVYVCDSQISPTEEKDVIKRNTLFTAITRSKAWVRICGIGSDMDLLIEEIDKVKNKNYKLAFDIPSASQLRQLRQKEARAKSEREIELIEEKEKSLSDLIDQLDNGEFSLGDLSESLRKQLVNRIQPTLDFGEV